MLEKPSLITRIIVGKTVGFVIGSAGFISLPLFLPEADWLIRWGILLWYTTVGAVIALMGVFDYHPVLKMPMPWWFLSPLIGAWLNFVLVFFAYDSMAAMLGTVFGETVTPGSPFWFAAEGAIVGLIIGYFATRFGGEGRETVTALSQ